MLVRKPVAINSQITSSHGNIGLNLFLPFNILTNLQGAARFTFSCLSHLVSYEMAKHALKRSRDDLGNHYTGWFSPLIKSCLHQGPVFPVSNEFRFEAQNLLGS